MAQDEIEVKNEHRYRAEDQWQSEIGNRDIEPRRSISHLDLHELIRGKHQVNEKKTDEEFPEKSNRLPGLLRETIKNKFDDDKGSSFVHGWNPYEDNISDEDSAQF